MYRVISADPAWQARDEGIRGGTAKHYKTLPLEAILAMGPVVSALADEAAYLFLWIPNFLLIEGDGARVCRAWGFEPKQMGTWAKAHIGTGHNLRNRTESYIVATRGGIKPARRDIPNHHYWPKDYGNRRKHSIKPIEFYRHVCERISAGPYLELFGREPRSGWDIWGNEVPGGGLQLPALDAAISSALRLAA